MGGMVPRPENVVLGGLHFASSDFCNFRVHGPPMRIDDLSTPSERFVARVSAAVTTVDRRPGRGAIFPAANTAFALIFAVPSEGGAGSAGAPAAATAVAQHAPSPTSTSQGADSAAITDPAASAPLPPGDPAPPTALPSSGRISTRTRLRTAAATGTAPPVVDYDSGPGGARRPPVRRASTPPRVPRPRAPLAVGATHAPAASPVPTVLIPAGIDYPEPVETLILRLEPTLGVPSATTADLDALGAAAELWFGDSAARCSHADWTRERPVEPACHAAMRYIVLGRPPALPADCFGYLTRLPFGSE